MVVGEYDYVCRLEFIKPGPEAFLRNHRIKILPCGHWIYHEKPDELAKLFEEFYDSL